MNQYGNIGDVERLVRYVFGGVLLMGMLQSLLPPAVAFVAVYAVLTAIISWEPFYALFSYAKKHDFSYLNGLIPYSRDVKELVRST